VEEGVKVKVKEHKKGRKAKEGRKEVERRKKGRTLVGVPRTSMMRDSWWTQFLLFQGEGRKEGKKVKEVGGGKVEKGRKDISEVR
jgi:hypothetical protein